MTWRAMVLAFLLALQPVEPDAAQNRIVGVASVIDGDTIEIHGVRIRFFGIDAPEGGQQCRRRDGTPWRCGQQAALALQDHLGRRPITCTQRDIDRFRRVVAQCRLDNEDINGWLVAQGWAAAYVSFSRDYVAEEQSARAAGIGVWSGEFIMPWDWRAGRRN